MVTGLGAVTIHLLVNYLHISAIQNDAMAMLNTPSPDAFAAFVTRHFPEYYDQVYAQFLDKWYLFPNSPVYADQAAEYTRQLIALQQGIPTVGASGAVYGVLLPLGFCSQTPILMLLFPPIPMVSGW